MVTVKISDINKVNAKGRTYYYFGRGRNAVRLPDDPDSIEFLEKVAELRREIGRPAKETLQTLANDYSRSPEFEALKPDTQQINLHILRKLTKSTLASMPVKAVNDPKSRKHFIAWRNSMRSTPRTADMAIAVIRRLFSWAIDQGAMTHNPVLAVGKIHRSDRSDILWTENDIELTRLRFPKQLLDPVMLALWTGQRRGDLVSLRWSDVDGDYIRLTQQKTNAKVQIYICASLREILDGIERQGPMILTNSRGVPWTPHGLTSSIGKAVTRFKLSQGIRLHDLRETFEQRCREAGCTESEIYSVTGRAMEGSARSYFKRTDSLSMAAMQKLEARFGNTFCKTLAKLPERKRRQNG